MGRKKAIDPKKQIRLFVENSKITKLGGEDALKEVAYAAINSKSLQ